MIALSTREPVAWSPPWNDKVTFLFKVGTVSDRARLEADLTGECGAGRVFGFQLLGAFEEGVATILKGNEDSAQIVEWARAEDGGEKLPSEERAALQQARTIVAEHWPPYRALLTRIERRREFVPVAAFRRFCAGWVGEDLPAFATGADGMVAEEALAGLDYVTFQVAGNFAYDLLYGGGLEKNSASPSKSGDGQTTSHSGSAKAAGKSKATATRKTPSSRSRTKRSQSSTSGSTAGG